MIFGGGHIADMISKYKTNMSMLNRKRYFNKGVSFHEKHKDQVNNTQELSIEDKKILQATLHEERRKEFMRIILYVLFSVILTGIYLYLIVQMVV